MYLVFVINLVFGTGFPELVPISFGIDKLRFKFVSNWDNSLLFNVTLGLVWWSGAAFIDFICEADTLVSDIPAWFLALKNLDNLEDQIIVSIQPDKGAGIFEEDTEYGNEAKFNYTTKSELNKKINQMLNSDPNQYESSYKYNSFKLWIEENYPRDKVWINHNKVLNILKKSKP